MIDLHEWIRMVLLYSHLMLCVLAMSQVFETDLKIILGKVSITALSKTSLRVGVLLFAMWISGLAVIYMDTGFDILLIAEDTKLQLKIICVTLLSLNSLLLHWYSLPAVKRQDTSVTRRRTRKKMSKLKSALIIYIAALSLSNWMLAAFIGIAEPLANLGFVALFKLYLVVQVLVFIVAMIAFPYLNKRLMLMKSEYDASQPDFFSEFAEAGFVERRRPEYSVIELGNSGSNGKSRPRRR